MRIGINASFLRKPQTGIGQVIFNLIKNLDAIPIVKDRKIEIILYAEDKIQTVFSQKYLSRNFLPLWKRDDLIRKIWWEKYLLPKKAQIDGCQVFISPYQCPTIMNGSIRHIMFVHDLIPRLFPEYLDNSRKKKYQHLVEKGISQADRIITISKATEKDLAKMLEIPAKKITVNYLDVDEIYKKEFSAERTLMVLRKLNLSAGYFLGGGGLESRKNIAGLMLAYKDLMEKNIKEKFVRNFPQLAIFGKTNPQLAPLVTDVEKLSRELNLTKNVRILGAIDQKDLPGIYKGALAFVYPSFYEGFGLPILEAMNLGVPVIASDSSAIPEVGGDAVLYCDPKKIDSISAAMKKIITDSELRETLVRRGRERARLFSWKNFTEKIINIALENRKSI